jgi:hypothetical protein
LFTVPQWVEITISAITLILIVAAFITVVLWSRGVREELDELSDQLDRLRGDMDRRFEGEHAMQLQQARMAGSAGRSPPVRRLMPATGPSLIELVEQERQKQDQVKPTRNLNDIDFTHPPKRRWPSPEPVVSYALAPQDGGVPSGGATAYRPAVEEVSTAEHPAPTPVRSAEPPPRSTAGPRHRRDPVPSRRARYEEPAPTQPDEPPRRRGRHAAPDDDD